MVGRRQGLGATHYRLAPKRNGRPIDSFILCPRAGAHPQWVVGLSVRCRCWRPAFETSPYSKIECCGCVHRRHTQPAVGLGVPPDNTQPVERRCQLRARPCIAPSGSSATIDHAGGPPRPTTGAHPVSARRADTERLPCSSPQTRRSSETAQKRCSYRCQGAVSVRRRGARQDRDGPLLDGGQALMRPWHWVAEAMSMVLERRAGRSL